MSPKLSSGVRVGFLAIFGLTSAYANSLTGFYYAVAASDADFGTQCCGTYTNMVQPSLGPNGLPVLNSSYGGPTINDVNASGEITWWSPTFNSHVTLSGSNSIALPFTSDAMYPPKGQNPSGNDASSYLAAIFTGSLDVPTTEAVTFVLGSDDDSFLYLNKTLVTSVGGVHGDSPAPVTSQTLTPGIYALTLFYVDRYPFQAALDFSITTNNVIIGTPEPTTVSSFGAGMLGLLGLLWARRRKSSSFPA